MKTFIIKDYKGKENYIRAFCKKSAKMLFILSLLTKEVIEHLMDDDSDMQPEAAFLMALDVQIDIFNDEYTIVERDVRGVIKDIKIDSYIMKLYVHHYVK